MELKNPYLHERILIPAVILVAMLVYLTLGIRMGSLIMMGGKTSESFFPVLLGIVGVPLAVKLLWDAVQERKKEIAVKAEKGEEVVGKIFTTPLILTGVSFLYIVLFHFIGLIPAVLIYVFLFMTFFDDKIQHLLRKFIYSLFITGFVYVLYWIIFNVQFDKMFFNLY